MSSSTAFSPSFRPFLRLSLNALNSSTAPPSPSPALCFVVVVVDRPSCAPASSPSLLVDALPFDCSESFPSQGERSLDTGMY